MTKTVITISAWSPYASQQRQLQYFI